MWDRDQPVKLLHQRGMPEFHLRPEKTLDDIGSLLGLRDRLTRG